VDARLGLACADLAASLPQASLDLVLANPPYLSTEELEASAPDVKGYEPHLALNGGEQGLEPLNRLLDQARSALRPGGLILVEIGWRQGDWAREALSTSAWGEVRVVRDLAGHERVLAARRTERG
jgi:release factor glutamine methyltransferase